MRIELLVEGDGDKVAIPSLVGKYFRETNFYIGNCQKIGTAKDLLNRPDRLRKSIKVALRYNPEVILYFSDCDEGCPVELARDLYAIAIETIEEHDTGCKFAVCILNPEYEVMFLLSHDDIEDCDACEIPIDELEGRRDAKNAFKKLIGGSYRETIDQKKYTKFVNFESIQQVDSCAHMLRVFEWVKNTDEQFYVT